MSRKDAPLKRGDIVEYISPSYDQDEAVSWCYVGGVYFVTGCQWDEWNDSWIARIAIAPRKRDGWWLHPRHLRKLDIDASALKDPYFKVCYKIRRMEETRKSLGYQF